MDGEVAIQEDGKVVVVGYGNTGKGSFIQLVRLEPNGDFDTEFGKNGSVSTQLDGGEDLGETVSIQSDGRILVAGRSLKHDHFFATALRFHSDGRLDLSFGNEGVYQIQQRGNDSYFSKIKLQKDESILLAGGIREADNHDFLLVHLRSDGNQDSEFSENGVAVTKLNDFGETISDLEVLKDGRIVVIGYGYDGKGSGFCMARYLPNGTLDQFFGDGGKYMPSVSMADDRAYSLVIQDDLCVIGGVCTQDKHDEILFLKIDMGETN